MAVLTYKVYPGGGGDYTSLASAISLIPATINDDVTFLLGPGDCGVGTIINKLWKSATIKPDTGYRHNGKTDQALSGIAYTTNHLTLSITVAARLQSIVMDGLRFEPGVSQAGLSLMGLTGAVSGVSLAVQNCLFNLSSSASDTFPIDIECSASGTTPTISAVNNIIKVNEANGSGGSAAAYFAVFAGNPTFNCDFNTVYCISAINMFGGVIFDLSGSLAADGMTVNCRNNDVYMDTGGTSAFEVLTGAGTFTAGAISHNASSDGTASLISGNTGGNIIAHTTDWSSTSNLTPTKTSPLNSVGVAVTGISTDNQGNTRPSPPAIGALEYIAPLNHPPMGLSLSRSGNTRLGLGM